MHHTARGARALARVRDPADRAGDARVYDGDARGRAKDCGVGIDTE